MINWGINSLNHGSSFAIIDDSDLISWNVYAQDSIPTDSIVAALDKNPPDRIFWYEKPWLKKSRQLYAGQYKTAFDLSVLPSKWLKLHGMGHIPVVYTPHHGSHAAAGYYTSPFDHCAVVVLDAIGEWNCASIWEGKDKKLTKVWSRNYPHSLGLFYSAFTKLIGLEPIRQEYLLQQMSEQGDHSRYYDMVNSYFNNGSLLEMNYNFHRGVQHWSYSIESLKDQCDIAAAVQRVFEEQVYAVMSEAKRITDAEHLVYMGGCAMNSATNKKIVEPMWKYIWSLPAPGDPSSAFGAVLYHTKQTILNYDWDPIKHIEIKI
jgi:carbamoyltransferase